MRRLVLGLALALGAAAIAPAQAVPLIYRAELSGPAEAPPNASPGTGYATVLIDPDANTMEIFANFSGLTGTVTAAHIHCCTTLPGAGTAGVATTTPTFPGFPSGVTAGTYHLLFDMLDAGTWRAGFITASGGTAAGAAAALLAGLADGRAYFNIHSTTFGGGEIRGFLEAPEPASLALAALALAGLAAAMRRRTMR